MILISQGFVGNEPSTFHIAFPSRTTNHIIVKSVSIIIIALVAKFSEKRDVEHGPFDGASSKILIYVKIDERKLRSDSSNSPRNVFSSCT